MSHHRMGIARNQMAFVCLEDQIETDNIVRVIDAFVDILDFQTLGFAHIQVKKTGTPPYHPALMLRIYLYGYLNRVRSSRKLETECRRNIEMQWLCEKQIPSYHTIATFRTFEVKEDNINHKKALKEVFRAFNRFLNGQDLFGKETIATDGTKIRAQNSKKKNYTLDKLDKKIELSDASISQYLDDLDQLDNLEKLSEEQELLKVDAKSQLEKLGKWKKTFETLKIELLNRQEVDPEVTQISLTDPDARSIVINNSKHAEIAYNIVTSVDEKYKLIANYLTENVKDITLLADSLIATKAELDTDFDSNLYKNEADEGFNLTQKLNPLKSFNGLADKGFHAATQIHQCTENGIVTYIAVPQHTFSGKDKDFTIEHFIYNQTDDIFTCPNNQILATNGKLYDKKNHRGIVVTQIKRYSISPSICAACPFAQKCLSKTNIKYRNGRQLERSEFQQATVDNKTRMQTVAGKNIYKKRQAIVEHPFGTIKRQWDCSYTLLKGLEKVNGEFAIIFTCYNLRRAVSILSVETLLQRLKTLKFSITTSLYRFFNAFLSLPVFPLPFNCVFRFVSSMENRGRFINRLGLQF
jgi:transposase